MICRGNSDEAVDCDRKHYDLFYEISYERFVDENGNITTSYKEDEETGRFVESSRKLKANLPDYGEQEIGPRVED